MSLTLDFHGAASTVTGSCYRIIHPRGSFLVDCGMFQGSKTLTTLNYGSLPFPPREPDFLLLTHAHIDHSGMIPRLVKAGFRGPIFATSGTIDLCAFVLPDAGNIQESEVARINRRNCQRGDPEVTPIYTRADAQSALGSLRDVRYQEWLPAGPVVRARFWNAGHILGSASIEVEIDTGASAASPLRLLFSGDLGPRNKAFHPDPDAPSGFDYLVTESTYGRSDRPELPAAKRRDLLRTEVLAALQRGGNLLIPAFAIERTQELLLDLARLFGTNELPRITVYVDSPMAIEATRVFMQHARELEDMENGLPFEMPNFHYVQSVEQSKQINRIAGGAIILAASGMCEAGRIRHHLKQNLWRPEATVLFVGYQAAGTLGHLILSGANPVRIHGEEVSVRANVRRLETYSGHADGPQLVNWVRERLPVQRGIFLTHGEEDARTAFRQALVAAGCGADIIFAPRLDDRFDLLTASMIQTVGRRLPPDAVLHPDWHHHYSATTLDLRRRLDAMPDNQARVHMLERVRKVMSSDSASGTRN